jgi:single-stranded DNA-specific DHH superfamily exonuclease
MAAGCDEDPVVKGATHKAQHLLILIHHVVQKTAHYRASFQFLTLSLLPSPEKFKDIDIACKRIKKAILEKETITIVGDYDVDGVVSTTIMLDFFNTIGVKVNHIIPNRF